jgi:protein O-mannosyl-transferase
MRTRLLLLAAALIAFGASLGSSFHFDDYAIFSDAGLTSPAGIRQIVSLNQTRPLTYLTFWMNYQLGGVDPIGYHFLNLILHLGAVLLAWACFRRLLPETAATAAAFLFAIHPLQAEAVNYVWARSIVLASLLCFAALLWWLKGKPWIAVLWFALALLAKEEVAAFPILLLLLDRRRWAPVLAMLALSAAAAARVFYALSVTPGAPAGLAAGISPAHYFLAQGIALWRYLRLLVLPYGFTVDPDIQVPPLWLGSLLWLLLVAAAVVLWRRNRTGPAFWALAGLILLLPSSSVFPAADLAADRRMYLPMFAFAAAAGLLWARIDIKQVGIAVVAVLVLLSCSRTAVWFTEKSLWTEAVERAPNKVRPKLQLARSLPAAKALELLEEARNAAPDNPGVAAEVGKILLSQGQPDAALTEFGRALALDPADARNINNRGVALLELGQLEAARADFERALRVDPNLTEARQNLEKLPPGR